MKDQDNIQIITCELCCEEVKKYKMAKVTDCEHEFCELCLQQYVQQKLRNFQIIKCPYDCGGRLDEDSGLIVTLTPAQRKKVKTIKFRKFVESQNWILCPSQKCQDGIVEKEQNKKFGKCSKCNQSYCLKCMLQKHRGQCQSLQQKLLKYKFNFKKCPKCQSMVERSQGCRHMTCKCENQFCYDCGMQWSDYHHCVQPRKLKRQIQLMLNEEEPQFIHEKISFCLKNTCIFGVLNKRFLETSCCEKILYIILMPFFFILIFTFLIFWIAGAIVYSLLLIAILIPVYMVKILVVLCSQLKKDKCRRCQDLFFIFLICIFPVSFPLIMIFMMCDDFDFQSDPFENQLLSCCFKAKLKPIFIYGISWRERQDQLRAQRVQLQQIERRQRQERRRQQLKERECIQNDKLKLKKQRNKQSINTAIKVRRKTRKTEELSKIKSTRFISFQDKYSIRPQIQEEEVYTDRNLYWWENYQANERGAENEEQMEQSKNKQKDTFSQKVHCFLNKTVSIFKKREDIENRQTASSF